MGGGSKGMEEGHETMESLKLFKGKSFVYHKHGSLAKVAKQITENLIIY